MKLYEAIQRAEDGGNPVPNGQGFTHGEEVFVVNKRELMELLAGIMPMILGYSKSESLTAEQEAAIVEAEATIDQVLDTMKGSAPLRELGTLVH